MLRLAIILLLNLEFMKHIIYWILFKTPLPIRYKYMKVNNLSKFPSLALFFIWKMFWRFLLKVLSTVFVLVCFVSLKESTCETKKNIFYFTLKALFVLEIIKFYLFRYSNVMASSNTQVWNTKHILLNNLEIKQSGNEIGPVYLILQKENFYQKILRKTIFK